MDRFYLENIGLYIKLISAIDPEQPAPHFSRHEAAPLNDEVTEKQWHLTTVVAARVRPLLEEDLAAGFPLAVYPRRALKDGAEIIDVHDLYNHPKGRPIIKSSKHQLDKVYGPDTTTRNIYADVVEDLVVFGKEGGVGTLFAYGQTGSGKTFTISELQRCVALALGDQSSLSQRNVFITIFDLAGNAASDLLQSRKPFSVLEDETGETQLLGAKEVQISSSEEMLALIAEAASHRQTAPTMKNDASSRTHSICRIRIKSSTSINGDEGLLYLVDLAGSEAARDVAKHGPQRMRETREINTSLSVLKDCIRGKAESETLKRRSLNNKSRKVHVPIRQSTLTKVLKHLFDPQSTRACRTVILACVNPSLADVGPSKNTLRYAEMLRAPTASRP